MSAIEIDFPWLQGAISQFSQYKTNNRIPQALLIAGQKGIGKQTLAEHYAQSILCGVDTVVACGVCQSCILFQAGTHPDFKSIEPEEEGKAIGIGIIRQLISQLALMPQFESYRVVLIKSADSLNNASANAFLKYLEEPTERTCIILISDNPSKLPATIRSRCQKMMISKPDRALVITWMQQQGFIENTELLLNLSQGSPLLAMSLADQDTLKFRLDCFKTWLLLAQSKENFIAIAEKWAKLAKSDLDLLINWIISWMVDTIMLAYKVQPDQLSNLDLVTDLQELSQRLNLKHLFKFYDFLLLSRQRMDGQLNKQLMFEEIFIQWSTLNSR